MNKNDFLKEAHGYIDVLYGTFENYQKHVNEIFGTFDGLCRKNGITYFVSCGSLLGLMRDGGNIPWDYDFDVSVPVNQTQKLLKVLKEQLPEEFYFDSNFTDKKLPFFQIRISKKGFDINHLHLDVFYLVGMPNENVEKFRKKITDLFKARWDIYAVDYFEKKESGFLKRLAKKTILKLKRKRVFTRFDRKFKILSEKYEYGTTSNVAYFTHVAEVFPYKAFEPKKDATVNGIKYFLPADADEVLKIHYGDYKKYLPIADRFDEFYTCANMLKKGGGL